MTPRDALITFVVPAAISLIVMLIARRSWASPVALAAGFCGIMPTVLGRMSSPWPMVSPDVIFYVAIFVAFIGLADGLLSPPRQLRMVLALPVLAVVVLLVLLRPLRQPHLRNEAMIWLAIAPVAAWLWWYIFDRPADKAHRWAAPLAMLLFAAFASVVLGMSHSVTYGRLGLALTGAAAPLAAIAVATRSDANGASVVAGVGILAALLLAGRLFTDLTVLSISLLAVAPVFYWRGQDVAPRHWPSRRRALISLLLLILPLATAIGLLMPSFLRSMRETLGGYGY